MEIDDLRSLVAPGAAIDVEATSILSCAEPLVVRVDTGPEPQIVLAAAATLRELSTVTVVVGDPAVVPAQIADAADVCITSVCPAPAPWVGAPVTAIEVAVAAQPEAALALVALLRSAGDRSVWGAVAAEAATYGMLLGSRSFRHWLEERPPSRSRPSPASVVRITRDGDVLQIELDRPDVHNAVNTQLRDELVAALDLPLADPTIAEVQLSGRGPCFSSGGDLAEFGSVGDPASSFAVRLTRHPGYAVHRVAEQTVALLHGSCIGAGIEVPAFAHQVIADPASTFRLPEIAMGLVPGAGGTVSIPRRIGRQRATWLALTGAPIDAATALDWGLVDRLQPIPA